MTKETILKRLFIEDKITMQELLILNDFSYQKEPTVYGPPKKEYNHITYDGKEIIKVEKEHPFTWDVPYSINLVNNNEIPYVGYNARIKYTN